MGGSDAGVRVGSNVVATSVTVSAIVALVARGVGGVGGIGGGKKARRDWLGASVAGATAMDLR